MPSNVSATVTADGNTYNTNASAINVMAPDLSIHGTTNVCSSSSYFINNLPSCNASVTWSVSNSNIASLSCTSCNSTTLTKLVDGTVTLTATITNTNACGSGTTVKTMTVNTGIPVLTSATYTYNGSQSPLQYYTGSSSYNPLCTSQNTDVNATFTGANTVTWTKVSSSNTVSWTQSGNDINFYLWGAGQTAVFNVDASNGCGDVSYNFGFQDFDCGGGGGCARYVVSNTNQSSLRVVTPNIPPPCRVAQTKKEKDAINKPVISQIKIYDMSGRLRVRNTFPGVKEALINTHGLTPGVYLIEISDGKTSEKQLVSIIK